MLLESYTLLLHTGIFMGICEQTKGNVLQIKGTKVRITNPKELGHIAIWIGVLLVRFNIVVLM